MCLQVTVSIKLRNEWRRFYLSWAFVLFGYNHHKQTGTKRREKWNRERRAGDKEHRWKFKERNGDRESESERENNQKKLKGRVGRREKTVTAQLMLRHEMALPLIMTEHVLEKRRERAGGGYRQWSQQDVGSKLEGGKQRRWRGNKSRYC